MTVLVTGGAGYIGSHTVVELLNANYDVVIVDNLCNSKEIVVSRIETITGKKPKFYNADIRDKKAMGAIFTENKIDSVIHFAGLKAVGESVVIPLDYYENNIDGTLELLRVMKEFGVTDLVFSSSATVYGAPKTVPILEDFPLWCSNPYGWTKFMIEQILVDAAYADKSLNVALLRYFNPIGAHKSGLIGEDPNGIPNNLMPYITQVSVGKLKELKVFGNDYKTKDGTGVRDYIHVVDLAKGHLLALEKLEERCGVVKYNLGTGNGYSVLEVVHAFEKANGVKIPYVICQRRAGDVDVSYADCSLAKKELGFVAQYDILDMCKDGYNWQQKNPNGY